MLARAATELGVNAPTTFAGYLEAGSNNRIVGPLFTHERSERRGSFPRRTARPSETLVFVTAIGGGCPCPTDREGVEK